MMLAKIMILGITILGAALGALAAWIVNQVF